MPDQRRTGPYRPVLIVCSRVSSLRHGFVRLAPRIAIIGRSHRRKSPEKSSLWWTLGEPRTKLPTAGRESNYRVCFRHVAEMAHYERCFRHSEFAHSCRWPMESVIDGRWRSTEVTLHLLPRPGGQNDPCGIINCRCECQCLGSQDRPLTRLLSTSLTRTKRFSKLLFCAVSRVLTKKLLAMILF